MRPKPPGVPTCALRPAPLLEYAGLSGSSTHDQSCHSRPSAARSTTGLSVLDLSIAQPFFGEPFRVAHGLAAPRGLFLFRPLAGRPLAGFRVDVRHRPLAYGCSHAVMHVHPQRLAEELDAVAVSVGERRAPLLLGGGEPRELFGRVGLRPAVVADHVGDVQRLEAEVVHDVVHRVAKPRGREPVRFKALDEQRRELRGRHGVFPSERYRQLLHGLLVVLVRGGSIRVEAHLALADGGGVVSPVSGRLPAGLRPAARG